MSKEINNLLSKYADIIRQVNFVLFAQKFFNCLDKMDGWLQFREVSTETCQTQILKEKCCFMLQQRINLVRNWVFIDNPFLRRT